MDKLNSLMVTALTIAAASCSGDNTVWLDEIESNDYYVQDWGLPQVNKSVARTPLSIGGENFDRGIGTHAISRMLFDVTGATRIRGLAGADDNNMFSTDLEFFIIGDRDTLWQSGRMTRGDKARAFDIDLSGIDKLLLLADMCDDEFMYDHADWVNVSFTTDGSDVKALPVWPEPVEKQPYILTPKAPDHPVINNAKVYGATPGADFLWSVMASGQRPMTYSATGLPSGLSIATETGTITGNINSPGEYKVTLHAMNRYGTDSKSVIIKIGDTISLTPIMGWSSWNSCRFDASDSILRATADIMADRLHPYGWTYVSVDDGWMAENRSADSLMVGNRNFPDMKALADYIHSKGMKFGIYSSPGPETCGGYPASYNHEYDDARTWAEWGVDYLKYDYCSHTLVEEDSSESSISAPYKLMREALDSTGRDIVLCAGYGAPNVWNWAPRTGANHWRTTRDITDQWNVVLAIANCQDVCAPSTKPGHFNDPDMMVVGHVGRGWGQEGHPSHLTPDEQYTHVSLWALLSAPMLLGCEMDKLDDFTLSLLTNNEVIAVNQDELCAPARKQTVTNGQIWSKPLADGSLAVGLFNIDPYFVLWDQNDGDAMQLREYPITLDLESLGISSPVKIRDLWRNSDEHGVYSGSITFSVPYHGVKLIKLTPQ